MLDVRSARALPLVMLLANGCSESVEQREVRLAITVQDDGQLPLAGVPITIDGVRAITSDAHGKAVLTLQAAAARASLLALCPAGYRPGEPRDVPLAVSRSTSARPVRLELVCKPIERTLLLVVRAPGAAGLPVRADGELLGVVAEDGTLHATLKRKPDAELHVMLDTSSAPLLVPPNPVRELKVADRDQILVFDQPLALAKDVDAARSDAAKQHTR